MHISGLIKSLLQLRMEQCANREHVIYDTRIIRCTNKIQPTYDGPWSKGELPREEWYEQK
jgi:hypothetical protein